MANQPIEPEGREIRADARDVRADARDVRADVTDTELQDRGVRADVREDVVTEREGSVTGSIRMIKWLIVVLIVISAGNFVRSYVNQSATDKATIAAKNAKIAADDARIAAKDAKEVAGRIELVATQARDILIRFEEAANNEDDPQSQAVAHAIAAIIRLEHFICGGLCPEPDG